MSTGFSGWPVPIFWIGDPSVLSGGEKSKNNMPVFCSKLCCKNAHDLFSNSQMLTGPHSIPKVYLILFRINFPFLRHWKSPYQKAWDSIFAKLQCDSFYVAKWTGGSGKFWVGFLFVCLFDFLVVGWNIGMQASHRFWNIERFARGCVRNTNWAICKDRNLLVDPSQRHKFCGQDIFAFLATCHFPVVTLDWFSILLPIHFWNSSFPEFPSPSTSESFLFYVAERRKFQVKKYTKPNSSCFWITGGKVGAKLRSVEKTNPLIDDYFSDLNPLNQERERVSVRIWCRLK